MHRLPRLTGIRCIGRCPRQSLLSCCSRAISTTLGAKAPRSKAPDKVEEPTINWYEQDGQHSSKRRRIDTSAHDGEAAKLKKEIMTLERDLKEQQKDDRLPLSALLEPLSEKDRVKVSKALQASRPKSLKGANIRVSVTRAYKPPLRRLNKCLEEAAIDAADLANRRALWRAYCASKRNVPRVLERIPDMAWELLWRTQSVDSPSNLNRLSHLKVLVHDMLSIGRQCDEEMEFILLEATFVEGDKDKAINAWEDWYNSSKRSHETLSPEALELGIRMHALSGDPRRALQILQVLLKTYTAPDPRVIIPVMDAFVRVGDSSSLRQAWALYRTLKDLLGSAITMQDYDAITLSFLKAEQTQLALVVFRDMMLRGSPGREPRRAFRRREHLRLLKLQSMSDNLNDINRASLAGLAILPKRWQNKFFFASWLKKLVGMRELDAAARVVELMFERGIKPDSIHLNGLINAWFQTEKAEDRQKAESMAWTMIQKRLDLVSRRRKANPVNNVPLRSFPQGFRTANRIPEFLKRPVPAATVETFSVLALHYVERGLFDNVRYLTDLLQPTEIWANAQFLTQAFTAELRDKNNYNDNWAGLVHFIESIKPKLGTYTALWDCLQAHMEKMSAKVKQGYDPPRILFSYMIAMLSQQRIKRPGQHAQSFTVNPYESIIRCFSLSKDLPGTLVAMHGMRAKFGFFPYRDTIQLIIQQIALKGLQVSSHRAQRTRANNAAMYERNVAKVTRVLEALFLRRTGQPLNGDFDIYKIDFDNQGETLLNVLSELIRAVMVRHAAPLEVEKAIDRAKAEMNVPEVAVGDVDSFKVA